MSENIVSAFTGTLVDSTKLLGKITGRFIEWFIEPWITETNQDYDFENYFENVKLFKTIDKEIIKPKQVALYSSPAGKVYKFSVPLGMTLKDFLKEKDGISTQIGKEINMRLKGSYVEIEIIENKLPKKINYKLPSKAKNDGIEITIGENLEGKIVINLKENPHTYIVGTTGSGKSVCTKSILTSISNLYSQNNLELYLCDLKRVELNLFSKLKHTKKFVYTVKDTTEVIRSLLEETENRYDLFMQNNVTNIFEYNKLNNVKKLKYQILFIEEVVMLLEDKSKKAMKLLKQLIAISRASGCYVFITTQRPSNDIIDSIVKANINNRIVFKCEDTKNSIVALDKEGAENLEGKGHGILKQGYKIKEFRGYFITDEQVNKYIDKYRVKEKVIQKEIEGIENKNIKENDKTNNENILTDMSFLENI